MSAGTKVESSRKAMTWGVPSVRIADATPRPSCPKGKAIAAIRLGQNVKGAEISNFGFPRFLGDSLGECAPRTPFLMRRKYNAGREDSSGTSGRALEQHRHNTIRVNPGNDGQ